MMPSSAVTDGVAQLVLAGHSAQLRRPFTPNTLAFLPGWSSQGQAFQQSQWAGLVSRGGPPSPGTAIAGWGFPLVQRVLVRPRWCLDCGLSLPGLVSLRRYVGSRNRPLAALATGGHRSFPGRGPGGAGFAGAVPDLI